MYNASATLPTFLHSICGQSYNNWKLILIDDCSSDEERLKCANIITSFSSLPGICDKKIIDYWNTEKRWEVANVLHGISMCEDNDIICRIDADDWLTDLDALMMLNECYKQTGAEAIWTAHRWAYTDQNISDGMPNDADPYKHPWVSSHLKTFRKYLLNNVNDENFRGEDGHYIRRAGDQAIYLPALYNAKIRGFFPRVMYHYTIKLDDPELFTKEDSKFQKSEADFIRARGFVK